MPCNINNMTAVEEVLAHQVHGNDMDVGAEEVAITTREEDGSTSEADLLGNIMNDMLSKVSTAESENPPEICIAEDDPILNRSPAKRLKDDDDCMEIDESKLVTAEDKENISKCVKRLSRKELEDLILVKTVEAIVKHSEAGKLRLKVSELQTQKDRMFQRVGHLQKQVQEMSRALKLLIDNHNRDPNNLNPNKKRPPPIKFFRSVGLQVAIEPPFRNGPTKVIHVSNEQPINGLKTGNTTLFNGPSGQTPIRRGPKGVDNSKQQVIQRNSPTQYVRVVNNNGQALNARMTGNVNQTNSVVKKQTKIAMSPSKINTVANPTVVDLTEDPNATSQLVTATNGVQYRIVNSLNANPMQFITSNNQTYQVVSQAGQVRPLILAQNGSSGSNQDQINRAVQAVLFPNTSTRPSILGQTRPSVTVRPAGAIVVRSGSSPRVAATIGTMVRAPSPASRKFQLPALPPPVATNIQRGVVLKELPPRPGLTLTEQADGIVLSWTMKLAPQHADIISYQIYACQESLPTAPGKVTLWKKVGDVKALPLPMACTLSQFTQGNRYYFIVRAVDNYGRTGQFCEPAPIILQKRS